MQLVVLGFVGTFVPLIVGNVVPNDSSELWFALVILPLPVAVVTAIVRHDLFQLDVVLNRTLVLVTTSVVLLAIYVAVVIAAVAITDSSSPWVAIPAAGVVAALATTVRAPAQRWVGHRLFGFGSDPAVVFHRLGARLSAVAEPDELLAAVLDSVTESLRLPYASIEIESAGSRVLVEQRGRPSEVVEWFDLVAGNDVAGWLGVSPRRDLQALTALDRALLVDLSSHLAVVVRLARVMNQLRAAQRQLIVAREDERHRIQRDLHDRIGPTLVGMSLQLSVAAEDAASSEQTELLTRLQHDASRATEDLRRLVRDLRPAELDEIGLPTAVEIAAARLGSAGRVHFSVEIPLRLPDAHTGSRGRDLPAVRRSNDQRGAPQRRPTQFGSYQPQHRRWTRCHDRRRRVRHRPEQQPGTGLTSMTERVDALGGQLDIGTDHRGGTQLHVSHPASTRSCLSTRSASSSPTIIRLSAKVCDSSSLDVTTSTSSPKSTTDATPSNAALHLRPRVAIIDLDMPELTGVAVIKEIARALPECRCLVLTMHDDDHHLFEALAAGAAGYLVKGASASDIEQAVRSAAAGQVIIGAEVAASVTNALTAARPRPGRTAFPHLSDRDLEILDRLAQGLDNTTIARQLHLAPKTIRNQVSALIDKLEATDRADAIRLARAAGLGGRKSP